MTSFSVASRPVTTLSGGLSCSSWTSRKEPDLVLRAHEEAERHLARLPTSTMLANRAAAPEPSGLALVIVRMSSMSALSGFTAITCPATAGCSNSLGVPAGKR